MKSNEDILASLEAERNCFFDYDIPGKKMFLDAMKEAQIEVLEEFSKVYYSPSSPTAKGVIKKLKQQIESQ